MNTFHFSTSDSATETNNRLRYALRTPITLDSYIALNNLDLWYNWRNITQELGNNKFTYTHLSTAYEVTLPDGSYSVSDINNFMHHTMENNGNFDATKAKGDDSRYPISIYENPTYNRITVKVKDDWFIIFPEGLSKVVGAEVKKFYSTTENLPNIPQLENVTSVQVHCNLVYNEYQRDSTLLYSFSPKDVFGALLSITPRYPQWRRTRKTTEGVVEVWLTDQSGRDLPLEDNWNVVLQIAPQQFVEGRI